MVQQFIAALHALLVLTARPTYIYLMVIDQVSACADGGHIYHLHAQGVRMSRQIV